MSQIIDEALARDLVAAQFPQWADLPVRAVQPGGWDNRTFRLGDGLLIRLPSAARYVAQVAKEQRWLPQLAPHLPLPIPAPVAQGQPGLGYPWPWSIYRWLDGENAAAATIPDLIGFAVDLARFLTRLHRIDAEDGPPAGAHNFHRGGDLAVYDGETRAAIDRLGSRINGSAARGLWDAALSTRWQGPPVWVHGDVSPGNLLVQGGRLAAVIDFGGLGVGDPACDLAIAWTLLSGENRAAFRAALPLDEGTWLRSQAWTLWKALILAAGLTETNAVEGRRSMQIIGEILG